MRSVQNSEVPWLRRLIIRNHVDLAVRFPFPPAALALNIIFAHPFFTAPAEQPADPAGQSTHSSHRASTSTTHTTSASIPTQINHQEKMEKYHTSLAPLIIPCSLSICTYCCSSASANAHGTPNKNALVLITHNDFPPNETVERVNEDSAETVLEMRRREEGGMMSLRAMRRSRRDSSSRVV